MKLRLLYVFSRATRAEQERMISGETPDDLVYGYRRINRGAFDVDFICRYQNEWSLARRLWFPFEYLIARAVHMGFALNILFDGWRKLRTADVVVTTADVVGLPIALLKYLGLLPGKLVYVSQGLSDRLEVLHSTWLRGVVRTLYGGWVRAAEVVLVLGEGAALPVREQLRLGSKEIRVVAFGVDQDFWTPGKQASRGDYVLSVGSDAARDYPTLLAATEGRQVKIVTRLPVQSRGGAEVSSRHSDEELRELYRTAAVVVTPLLDVAQPSGQSATLQAMACGRAVILTRTRGLWDPAVMRHGYNCYLVEPGDARGLRDAIGWLFAHSPEAERMGEQARRTVEQRYTSQQLARAIETVVYATLRSH